MRLDVKIKDLTFLLAAMLASGMDMGEALQHLMLFVWAAVLVAVAAVKDFLPLADALVLPTCVAIGAIAAENASAHFFGGACSVSEACSAVRFLLVLRP
ncbi:hypothetical protein PF005_g26792 [Phytophthora fragariae]|uniref:Uncharacterized protein n=1 Tax=Phytophthora fragariae TaxID=53985 RepID=A0A6A3R1G7_9STRA|nr:hypothetical protein PF011_g25680 [Phytophthora fragariae]KAE9087475.1 hypothetical protein PF006_g25797 [Phytophthora fragariae]KAE9172257.1 hypothetical protein PF005_g26792 [Phytophthora fragariae]KAE9177303.1 hypothetical protein PF004_g25815 [Phytophthora fragariae]KAE9287366.1 hypothetical protein PF008_g26427 [Phytophthora fragariae]